MPGSAPAQLQLARVSLLRGDTATALDAANRALDKQPDNAIARLMFVDALLASHDIPRAEQEITRLKTRYPNVAAIQVLDGKLQGVKAKYPEATRAFQKALTLDPTSVDAALGLIGVDLASGDADSARKRSEALLARRPNDPAVRMLAARAYRAANDAPKAEALLQQIVQQNAKDTVAIGMLGDLYLAQGKLPQALEQYEALTRLDPKSVAAHTVIGMVLQKQNRGAEARKKYEQVLEIDPNAGIAANNLAWMLAEQGEDLDRALVLANKAASVRPGDPQVADTIGWIYYRKQLPTLAVPRFERAVELDPKNAGFEYHLGLAHAAVGDTAKARLHLQKALTLDPAFEGAADARTVLQRLKG